MGRGASHIRSVRRVTVVTKTDPETGADIPACSLCGVTLSRIPRGKATEADINKIAHLWTVHVIEKHPDTAQAIVDGKA